MKTFFCQLLTKEKKLFESNITSLVVPTQDGYLGVMANHASMIALLGSGRVDLKDLSGEERKVNTFNILEGVLEVHKNVVTLLVEL